MSKRYRGQGTAQFDFTDRAEAWAFMRACDAAGFISGYPNHDAENVYSVKVVAFAMLTDISALATKHNGVAR